MNAATNPIVIWILPDGYSRHGANRKVKLMLSGMRKFNAAKMPKNGGGVVAQYLPIVFLKYFQLYRFRQIMKRRIIVWNIIRA